jgi:MOSC domain-containing protein YiiM
LPDDEVCIGDRYQIGSALFEVTQPRRHLLSSWHSSQ